jgi:hypothetical protein
MPNVLGTLAPSAIIVQEALDLVFTERPMLNEISLDLSSGVIVKQGQQVISRIFGIPTVGDFGDAAGERADVDVPVTIDKFKQVKHTFTPAEYNQTDRALVRESARPIAVAIGNHLVDAIAALWLEANFSNETVLANGWDYEHLVTVRQAMVTRGLPEGAPRFYCGNADVYGSLLKDPVIVSNLNNAANGGAISTGKLPRVAGFGLSEYPALPTTNHMVGFAGTKDSCVLAARIPTDPRTLLPGVPFSGTFTPITNPRTGFTVILNEYIDADTLNVTTRVIFCYGAAKGNAANGQRIVSQT